MALINDCDVSLYEVPNEESLDDATQSFESLELVVATLTTADGVEGMGFTYTIGRGGSAIAHLLESTIAPMLVGEPSAPRTVRETIRAGTTFIGREGISELAISAVDVALWDALGKRAGLPLYELLGGERSSVSMYQTDGGWLQYDEETLVANAERIAAEGFAGMKMKVGRSPAEDERRVRAVRETLPAGVELMLDGNCSYTVSEARLLANRISDLAVAWFEEPLEKGDYAGYADLRSKVDVPIALGENLYNETQFSQVVDRNAADVLQPDVCRVGGITPWLAVANAAQTHGIPVSPHYVEPLHAHLALPFDVVPYIERHSTVLDTVVEMPVVPEDGAYTPPDDPGHGIEFDGLERHRRDIGS
jgi:L-alanine-DL-glutamate epimerase-like enolase superfamily enzyme